MKSLSGLLITFDANDGEKWKGIIEVDGIDFIYNIDSRSDPRPGFSLDGSVDGFHKSKLQPGPKKSTALWDLIKAFRKANGKEWTGIIRIHGINFEYKFEMVQAEGPIIHMEMHKGKDQDDNHLRV